MRMLIFMCLALILEIGAYPLFEGDSCELSRGGEGKCVAVTECPEKMLEIQYGNRTTEDRCSFNKWIEIVCCQKSSSIPPVTETFEIPLSLEPELPPEPLLTTSTTTRSTTIDIRIPDMYDDIRPAEKACNDYTNMAYDQSNVDCQIMGGTKGKEGEFPYIAALKYRTDDNPYQCGGSLISTQHILTAAHCFKRNKPYEVKLGSTVLNDAVNETVVEKKNCGNRTSYYVQNIPVAEVIVHPKYKKSEKYYDIAILKLASKVKISKRVKPICLQSEELYNLEVLVDASQIQVAGWGHTESFGTPSDILFKTSLTFVDRDTCNNKWKSHKYELPRGIDDSIICMFGKNGSDSCQGDSGGPVAKRMSDDIHYLIALVSFGDASCGSAKPALYTNVYHYLDWIEEVVWPKKVENVQVN